MKLSKTSVLVLWFALAGCAHPWPPEGRGGLAERNRSIDPAISEAVQAVDYLKVSPGNQAPAKVAQAEDRLIRASREYAGGLYEDADKSYLDAVVTLGGNPEKATDTGVVCIKQPCKAVK